MNILPHKSWHVYNQKNRDRVRQDEALAEAKEHEIQERNTAADREHRLNVLRARAQRRLSNRLDDQDGSQDQDQGQDQDQDQGQDQDQDQDQDQTVTIGPTPEDTKSVVVSKQHINFWADSGQQEPKKRQGNPENEAEQKAKQEKWDRTIAMHLDTGIKGHTPWYAANYTGASSTPRKKHANTDFVKTREDPLNIMKTLLDKRDRARMKSGRSPSPTSREQRPAVKKSRTESTSSTPVIESKVTQMSTMDKLRKERLERERAERVKEKKTLDPTYVDPSERYRPSGAYSQQFNPQATLLAHSSYTQGPRTDRSDTRDLKARRTPNGHDHSRDRDGDSRKDPYRSRNVDHKQDGDRRRDVNRRSRNQERDQNGTDRYRDVDYDRTSDKNRERDREYERRRR